MEDPSTKSPPPRGHAYSVVLTIDSPKANKLNIHIVPTNWIEKDVLYYPPGSLGKSVIDGLIISGPFAVCDKKKWSKYAFILKKTFKSFELADKYLQSSIATDDSDTDDVNLKLLQKKQAAIKQGYTKGKNKATSKNLIFIRLECIAIPII